MNAYVKACGGDIDLALRLYDWNILIAQALLFSLQCYEVAIRNKLNEFFSLQYGSDWPTNSRFRGALRSGQIRELDKAIDRATRKEERTAKNEGRPVKQIGTNEFVCELNLGFWNAMFTKSCDQNFGWTKKDHLRDVFPDDHRLDRQRVYDLSEALRLMRNRIAHAEPIHNRQPSKSRAHVARLLKALCTGTYEYTNHGCKVSTVMALRPA